jgi:AmmeMemoRadiSam system protein B
MRNSVIRPVVTFAVFFLLFPALAWAEEGTLSSPYEVIVARALESVAALSENAEDEGDVMLGGVVPHHDLAIDMITRFYQQLAGRSGQNAQKIRRVWLFAPDHFKQARRSAAVCDADWRFAGKNYPKGISADKTAVETLGRSKIVELSPKLFAREHGITLHIPLIARFFPGASVVPIVLRPDIPDRALLMLRNRIGGILGEGDVIILSMDLSHYKPPEAMAIEDNRTLGVLTNLKYSATAGIDADARRAAALVLALFRDMGAERGELLEHADSSALLGERTESGTSYATLVYRARTSR